MFKLFGSGSCRVLANAILDADEKVRIDFQRGIIVDENDYTSNFTQEIRNIIQNLAIPGLKVSLHAQKVNSITEKAFGVDAAIILTDIMAKTSKIILFEAKQLRNNWDYLNRRGESHFSTQLDRQSRVNNYPFAIWEQVYNRSGPIPIKNNNTTSNSICIWHEDAYNYKGVPCSTPWTNNDVINLASSVGDTVDNFMYEVCICNKGKPISTSEVQNHLNDLGGVIENILTISYEEKVGVEETVLVNVQ